MSSCSYCAKEIVWIRKPNGGWFPPFDSVGAIETVSYQISWDSELGDWTASPTDTSITAKLDRHHCVEYLQVLERRRQKQVDQEEEPEPQDLPSPQVQKVVELVEIVKYRSPTPEQYVRIALKLQEDCPICYAGPFEWCTYKSDPTKVTSQLHGQRGIPNDRGPSHR